MNCADALVMEFDKELARVAAAVGPIYVNKIRDRAGNPCNTGTTVAGVQQTSRSAVTNGEFTITVENTTELGRMLDYGFKSNVTKPREKQALYWDGARHPVPTQTSAHGVLNRKYKGWFQKSTTSDVWCDAVREVMG